jgi:hypothetical protein
MLIAAGAVLPGELALGRDRAILGEVHVEPLDTAELSEYVNISMVDRVGLLGQRAGTNLVPLKTGAVYSQDSVRRKLVEELEKLYEMRFYPLPVAGEFRGFNAVATLYIQNDGPARNMILWEIDMRTDNLSGQFHLDDQTGKILSFSVSGSGFSDCDYSGEMIDAWANYLGVDARQIRGQADTGGSAAQERQTRENRVFFELYSGLRSVSGQFSSEIHGAPGRTNRWRLNYLQSNY